MLVDHNVFGITMLIPRLLSVILLVGGAALGAMAAERDIYDLAGQRAAPAGTKRIVFIGARGTHGARGNHEFLAGGAYFARRINAAYPNAWMVVQDDEHWPADLAHADAVVVALNHGGRAADDGAIAAAMARGAGFMAIHFGVEVNKGAQGDHFLAWMGGYFETYWSVNPTWKAEVSTIGDHPTARGVKPFELEDEWYYHMRFAPGMAGVTPILSAVPPADTVHLDNGKASDRGGNPDVIKAVQAHEPQHLAWAFERPDHGRGFGFTGFHQFANLTNDSFRTTLLNGVAWVSGLEIPAQGVPSTTPTKDELEALLNEAHTPRK